MPLLEFESCRQRIRRAKAHREAIRDLWNEGAAEEDLYSVRVSVKDDGAGSIWLKPNFGADFADAISLELGEMLYQLRAALDSCIYASRIRETGKNPPPTKISSNSPSARIVLNIAPSTEHHSQRSVGTSSSRYSLTMWRTFRQNSWFITSIALSEFWRTGRE